MRKACDFSPLYRSMIGVDRLADLVENATRSEGDRSYPPYDVEKTTRDGYRITLAAADFSADELEITTQPNLLIIVGRKARDESEVERTYLHRGIAARDFERRFELADHVTVTSARYDHGVLVVDLVREVPEALKPRRIEIGTIGNAPQAGRIEGPKTDREAA